MRCICLLLLVSLFPLPFAQADERPNIVIIMSDDMGFSDIGCYGGEIETPNLNRLAENGLRFSQFYNTGRCCPTRASLLTGLHPHQAGIGHMTFQHDLAADRAEGLANGPYQGWLNRHCVTIAEVLGLAGYGTYMAGKWHVGTLDKNTWPRARGFDRYYGLINGASSFFAPLPNKHLTLEEEVVEPTADDFYTTDYFTNYALEFLDDHQERHSDEPFFLYLAYTCPHWPLQAWPDDVTKYRGKYKIGWDELRRRRLARQRELGLVPAEWELTPRDPAVPAWETLDAQKQDELDHLMAIYAAMVDRMDQNIGRVVAKLEEQDKLDNTLILFLDDNGACAEGRPLGSYDPERLGKVEHSYGDPKYGNCWANASNTPFRLYKHWVHEGGMSSPLIAHWPEGMSTENRGKITRQYGYLPDLMATCLELADAEYPRRFAGNEIIPLEGKSLVPILRGGDTSIHAEPICWEHEGNAAVRDGKWKLVRVYRGEWELYDIEADRSELHDLAEEQPERAEQMAAVWDDWSRRVGVMDWRTYQQAPKTIQQEETADKEEASGG